MVLRNTIFELQRQILKMVKCCLNTPSWYGSSMVTRLEPHIILKRRPWLLLLIGELSISFSVILLQTSIGQVNSIRKAKSLLV